MTPQSAPTKPRCDLGSLSRVVLSPHHQAMLEAAQARNAGPPPWRHRKVAEATDLARLAQLSNRLVILGLDLSTELRAELLLRVTVPCLPKPSEALRVAGSARLGLVYRAETMVSPQPGYSFVQILAPRAVWHANVSFDPRQVLCLGTHLPVGIPVREVVLLCYMALTMVAIQLDPANAAGVLNPAAADWWQRNSRMLPLSREPFLERIKEGS